MTLTAIPHAIYGKKVPVRFLDNLIISTEGRNHTRNSTKIDNFDYGAFSVISPFGRNDKKCGTTPEVSRSLSLTKTT